MKLRQLLSVVAFPALVAGCALMADLEYGPGRLKPADPGMHSTYPVQTPASDEETARPSPGSVAPLHQAPRARTRARAPRPAVRTTPPEAPATPQIAAPEPPRIVPNDVDVPAPVAVAPKVEPTPDPPAPKVEKKAKKCSLFRRYVRRKCPTEE